MPIKSTVPRLGKKCGRRERESRREGRREQSLRDRIPSRGVAVKDILVFWKAAPFAGGRWNEDLGRSVSQVAVSPLRADAPMTADARRTPRRGTPSAGATKRMHPTQAREIVACAQGTRPSLGPSTRARQSSLCTAAKASVVGRSRRHHGWASSRKRDEPALGPSRMDEVRLATCHRFRKGEGVTR
jgi:hypothetical protein